MAAASSGRSPGRTAPKRIAREPGESPSISAVMRSRSSARVGRTATLRPSAVSSRSSG